MGACFAVTLHLHAHARDCDAVFLPTLAACKSSVRVDHPTHSEPCAKHDRRIVYTLAVHSLHAKAMSESTIQHIASRAPTRDCRIVYSLVVHSLHMKAVSGSTIAHIASCVPNTIAASSHRMCLVQYPLAFSRSALRLNCRRAFPPKFL